MNLLGLMTFAGLMTALVITIKNLGGSQIGLIIVLGEVALILFLSALKYYRDTPFWLTCFSFPRLWSLFKKNTTRVDIPTTTIKNPVGSMAPRVLMNGTTPENSTAFLYKAESGKSYLARDTNFAKNGGAFYEIISSNDTGCDISLRKQTKILYTDLKNGGFFEYPSSDPKHAGMEIMMNTPTIDPSMTKYASRVSNAKNNFLQGLNYAGFGDSIFVNITKNWLTGDGFEFNMSDFILKMNSFNLGSIDITLTFNSTGFRNKWIPTGWTPPNDKSYLLMMNTDKIISTTKYLLLIKSTNLMLYISNDGLNYNQIDPRTGGLMGNTIVYDYKKGTPPDIRPPSTNLPIIIDTIRNPIINAPGVFMNGTAPENSTAFLYRAESGKSYLARDTNFAKNGGAFYEIISSNDTGCIISLNKQTEILYTDLKNGGFFEYPSLNPKHAGMEIMMNTPTVNPFITKYASRVSNAKNNLPQGLNYAGFGDSIFVNITKNWLTGDVFDFDIFDFMLKMTNLNLDSIDATFIFDSLAFRNKWIPAGWTPPNNRSYSLMMNTATIISDTKYLLLIIDPRTIYISNDGLNYNEIDPINGGLMGNTIIYDYKKGTPPDINQSSPNLLIIIDTIRNPVGSDAPGVLMNGTAPENSTAFLYRAESGKSYLARDTNFAKNGGAFHEIISSNDTGCIISLNKQTEILYTDLKNGGFFEYPLSDPKYAGMEIMMNTPTVDPSMTRYASRVSNAKNNFPQGLNYAVIDDFTFVNITKNWLTGDGFEFNMSDFMEELMSGFGLLDITFIFNSTGFRNKWIPAGWIPLNDRPYSLIMSTAMIVSDTKYLLIDNLRGFFYISDNGLNYNEIDPMTRQLTGNSFIYDYTTGTPPNIMPNVGPQN